MDSEQYYDSLEEDSSYGSFEGSEELISDNLTRGIKKISRIPVKTKTRSPEIEIVSNCELAEDDVIPFYDHCLSKSEVEMKKMLLNEMEGQKNKSKNKFCQKRAAMHDVKSKFKSNTYLDMFYAKMGVEKIDLSNRATCDELTPKSYTTCEDLEQVTSVYLSDFESVYSSQNVNSMEDLSLSLTSLDSKFCSISQINNYITNKVKPKNKKACVKLNGVTVPELGRLGPEIPKDKLELLKKRQDYGQKVSKKNKIKMIERKLLQNLQQEINECKKIA